MSERIHQGLRISVRTMVAKVRLRAILLVALVTSVIFAAYFLFPHEPTYEGKPFSYFLSKLPVSVVLSNQFFQLSTEEQSQHSVYHEVNAVGTNGLSILMTRLESKDSRLTNKLRGWALKLGLFKNSDIIWLSREDTRRGQALTALLELGPRAKEIAPQLVLLTKHPDSGVSTRAIYTLKKIAPEEYEKLPENLKTVSPPDGKMVPAK